MSTDIDVQKLKEAAEELVKHPYSSKARFRLSGNGRSILALIAGLEAAEALADTWREAHDACRSRMEADLAADEKLIEVQHEALKVCEATLDVLGGRDSYGIITVCGQPVPEAVATAWEDAEEVCVPALALYEAYKKDRDDG